MNNDEFSVVGGANIGFVNASWPFARLSAEKDKLTINIFLLGNYTFSPEETIQIEKCTLIPLLAWGVKINHNVANYPKRIIFFCFSNPKKLIARISKTGFLPKAKPDTDQRKGMPFRWSTVIASIIVWNALIYFATNDPTVNTRYNPIFFLFPLALAFTMSIGAITSPFIQKIILKPNRDPGEIKPVANLVAIVTGCILFMFTLLFLTGNL